MKTYIGFTGTHTHTGLTSAQQIKLGEVIRLKAPDQIEAHHGLCVGGDDTFHQLVEELYKPADRIIVGHPATDKKKYVHKSCDEMWPAKEYKDRNRDIVNETDILIACPKQMKEVQRGSTWHAIRFANSKRKPFTVIWPDGSVQEWPDGSVEENDNKIDMREAKMTESQKEVYISQISKLLWNGVTEVDMREVMNAISKKPEDHDLRLSNSWFEANGFSVEARSEFSRHPNYEIVRTYVRKAQKKGDGVEN